MEFRREKLVKSREVRKINRTRDLNAEVKRTVTVWNFHPKQREKFVGKATDLSG